MLTAIILSGQLRQYQECFPSLRDNILKHNNCHIYMHTYIQTDKEDIHQAIKLYRPQKLLLENPVKDFRTADYNQWPLGFRKAFRHNLKDKTDDLYWQHRNLQTIFGEVPSNTYDCIVKARYDLKYYKPIKFAEYSMDNINIPDTKPGQFGGGLLDVFAFSCYDHMRYYCNMIDKINQYVEEEAIRCVPEVLLLHHLRNKPILRMDFPISLREIWMTL